MRVVVDEDRCCSAGSCAAVAPEVFDQSEDTGTVIVLQETLSPALVPLVEEAADLCPVAAIRLAGS